MRIAFIADIHSNLEAFETVMKDINKMKIEIIFCLGDVIGYGANPNECLEIIRKRKIPCCLGNHELAVIKEETYGFNPFAAEAILWTADHVAKDNLEFIKKFPERIETTLDGFKILMVHGSPFDSINDYVYPEYPLERIVNEFNYDVIVMAHTHVPFIRKVKDSLIINCGSVGQPRDRNSEACYVIFDSEVKHTDIIRVKYDVKATSEKIIKSGLPHFLGQRLFLGI
jgi:putative phosphoesterase